MSVQGLCQVCESATADRACDNCGRQVCADHYETSAGLCTVCASSGAGDAGREGLSGPGADDVGPGTYTQ